MQTNTETTVRVLIQTLPTTTRAKLIRELLAELPDERQDTTDRICRRAEAAKILGRSLRGVDLLREGGHLKQVVMPGRIRAAGFLLSDVQALLNGRAA